MFKSPLYAIALPIIVLVAQGFIGGIRVRTKEELCETILTYLASLAILSPIILL